MAVITPFQVVIFGIFLFLVILALAALFLFDYYTDKRRISLCPYTKKKLRYATDIHFLTAELVLKYLYYQHEFDNQMFDFKKAALCRDTGRFFPDCVTWYGSIEVDWSFLVKRYPGNWISWGSLSSFQQQLIRDSHDSLEGYQTEFSSPNPSPRAISPEYAYSIPGPLYVDVDTHILLGWKIVPETDLEVMIVQKPKRKR